METRLQELLERELDQLELKRLELTEKRYPHLSEEIKRVADLTGMSEEMVVSACVSAAWHYKDLEWHDVLDVIKSFYLAKRNIEEKHDN